MSAEGKEKLSFGLPSKFTLCVQLPLTRECSSNKYYLQGSWPKIMVHKVRKYHIECLVQLFNALKAQAENRHDWSGVCIPQQRVIKAISPPMVSIPFPSHTSRILLLLPLIFSTSTISMGSFPSCYTHLQVAPSYKNIKPCSFYYSFPFSIKILEWSVYTSFFSSRIDVKCLLGAWPCEIHR